MASSSRGNKWTELMRLTLIETVIRVDQELRKGGVTDYSQDEKWNRVTAMIPLDLIDQPVFNKRKHALRTQFFSLRRLFFCEKYPLWYTNRIWSKMKECEDLSFNVLLEPKIEPGCDLAKHEKPQKWTEGSLVHLIEMVILAEKERVEECGREGMWKGIVERIPNGLKASCRIRFYHVFWRYRTMKQKQNFSYRGLVTERVCEKLREYDEMCSQAHVTAGGVDEPDVHVVADQQDGVREHVQDPPCAPIQDQGSLPSSQTSSRRGKRARPEASPPTSSSTVSLPASSQSGKRAMSDASPPSSLRIGQRYPETPVGHTQRQKTVNDSAASRDEAKIGPKRTKQCQGYNISQHIPREDVENLLKTFTTENMKSSLFLKKLLEGLPEGKTVVDKLGEFLVTEEHAGDERNHRTSLPESTTCLFDKFIQQHTQNRLQLMIQAKHEELKVRMTEVIKQTSSELLHLLLNFTSGES